MDTTILKVGGSLQAFPTKLRALCDKIRELSQNYRLIIVPGGGEFADAVRELDRRFVLSPVIAHRMALLAMDQYGLMLTDLLKGSCSVNKLDNLFSTLDLGKLPVFLPSTFMFEEDPLENTWDVTSDSIAVYIAWRLRSQRTILITDVDGIYPQDPKFSPNSKLIKKVAAQDMLTSNGRTSVDAYLPKLLLQLKTDCLVVNGFYPSRVEALLAGQETVCTEIIA